MKAKIDREPLIRISKRDYMHPLKSLGVRGIGLVMALVICAIIIYGITALNPLDVYGAMIQGAFGTVKRTWVMIRDTMMLLCISIGLAPAFKMKFWNIGAEGQVLVGGVAAAGCMIYLSNSVSTLPLLIIMFVASAALGAVWGFVPGFFKAKWDTNETLFTLMMNYIAIQLTSYFVALWENPFGSSSVGVINPQTHVGWFPEIFGEMYMLNVIIVVLLMVGMYIYLNYSKHGFEIAVVGDSERTARYAAIDVKKVIVRTMVLSGAICGIAGFLAVAGASHTISTSTAGGQGFTAIIVAWLSQFNTFIMAGVSALLVFLSKGAMEIASRYNLSDYVSSMITGIILFFILGSEFFIRFKVKFRNRKGDSK